MKTKTAAACQNHFNHLAAIFPGLRGRDPLNTCRALRRLEVEVTRWSEAVCNGDIDPSEDERRSTLDAFDRRLIRILGAAQDDPAAMALHINLDPRGYALKLDDEYVRANDIEIYRDWGGYGIIAPDLSE